LQRLFAIAASLLLALTPQQQRGKQLYLTGESAAPRKPTALISADEVEVSASVVPCASCHGRDGKGRAEGGITPANIRWDTLLQATDARPAYTKPLLKRAIAMGIGANGKPLEVAMPRYRMTLEDMSDLLAYLEQLPTDRDPGLSDDAIRIGAVLPPNEDAPVRTMLTKYYAKVGPIFGRTIEPVFATTSGSATERATALQHFVDTQQPFAIAASWLTGADAEMAAVAETTQVPTIAAFSIAVSADAKYVYPMLAGEEEQGDALVAAAGGTRLLTVRDEPPVVGDHDMLLYLGAPSHLASVLAAAAAAPAPPFVLIPAAHSSGAVASLPPALKGRVLIALPSSAKDVTEDGAAELQALGVAQEHVTACRIALASAKLLVEALRRNGRDVSRESLVNTLDAFYAVPTGVAPPVTWAAGKHTGSSAVTIMRP